MFLFNGRITLCYSGNMFYTKPKVSNINILLYNSSIIYLSAAQSDMKQIYTPYVILLVNILSIAGSHLECWTYRRDKCIQVQVGEFEFFDMYSFSSMRLFILLEEKKPRTTEPNQKQNK